MRGTALTTYDSPPFLSLTPTPVLLLTFQESTGDLPGLTSSHSLMIMVNALPDTPSWSAPQFPLMAAEDEAMLVPGVSLQDPDGDPDDEESRLRVGIRAEQGRVGLPGAANASSSLEVEEGIGDDGEGDGSLLLTGEETALNLALAGLVYYPPPDWTSFTQVTTLCLPSDVGYNDCFRG